MTAKELVERCEKRFTCKDCPYTTICDAYHLQFKHFPFLAREFYESELELISDVEIQIPNFVI